MSEREQGDAGRRRTSRSGRADRAAKAPGEPGTGDADTPDTDDRGTDDRGTDDQAPGDRTGTEEEPAGSRPGAPGQDTTTRQPTPVTQQIGRAVVLLLLVLFGVFAATNAHTVDFSWVFGETEVTETAAGERQGGVPLIVLLVISLMVGAIVGAVVAWQGARAKRRGGER